MKRPRYYRLDEEHHLVKVKSLLEWARWYETADRVVELTQVSGACRVSTIFLGIDHRFVGDGPPVVFETMIFGGPETIDQTQWRYSSWDDAETGHAAAVRKVLAIMKAKART